MRLRTLHIAVFACFLVACKTYYEPHYIGSFSDNVSKQVTPEDSAANVIIKPYKAALDTIMLQVLIQNTSPLQKAKPEGTLNNMFCDVQLQLVSRQNLQFSPLFCVMNYGGIRLPSIQAGTITRGKVYELMPFDNELVVAQVKGSTIKDLCNRIAQKGGEPVAGIKMRIQGLEASDIRIQDKPLNDTATYYMLLSDYMLNGGDGYGFVKEQAQEIYPLGLKVRDVIISELEWMQAKGQTLNGVTDGRITEVK